MKGREPLCLRVLVIMYSVLLQIVKWFRFFLNHSFLHVNFRKLEKGNLR